MSHWEYICFSPPKGIDVISTDPVQKRGYMNDSLSFSPPKGIDVISTVPYGNLRLRYGSGRVSVPRRGLMSFLPEAAEPPSDAPTRFSPPKGIDVISTCDPHTYVWWFEQFQSPEGD